MLRSAISPLRLVLLTGLLLVTSVVTAAPAEAATRTCRLDFANFTTARATNVRCTVARSTVRAWWTKGGTNSRCYTYRGCRVGDFRCGVRWEGYVGYGRCFVYGTTRKITFKFGS